MKTTLGKAVIGLSKTLGVSAYNAAIKEIAQTISGAWTFTSALTVQIATAATALTLRSTAAGAASGPFLVLNRHSAAAANNDLGLYGFSGQDSAGNTTTYAYIVCRILDPTNGSEDARVRLNALIAGADTQIMSWGPGTVVGAATGGDQGIGTLNAQGLFVNGVAVLTSDNAGIIAQKVTGTSTTYQTCPNQIPLDDTIPQNTEGDQILSVVITPTDAGSTLVITVTLPVIGTNASQNVIAALFVSGSANALNAGVYEFTASGQVGNLTFVHQVSAGSTAARTYSVRLGSSLGTNNAYLNGTSAGRRFGGIATAMIEVVEFLP